MGDNTLGTLFKITSFGESHGDLIGIIVDGVPAGFNLDINFIQDELDKRKPAQSFLTTTRSEKDIIKILSGTFNKKTTGAPICIIIENEDIDSSVYEKYRDYLRPSHVDFTASKKFGGFADYRGSGRFSGRTTAGFVMAGAIAKQILLQYNIKIFAYTKGIGSIIDDTIYNFDDYQKLLTIREKNPVRSLNLDLSKKMEELIQNAKDSKDSRGGTIKCSINNFPPGIGGPVFNSLESNISKAIFSIPAVKGIEFGAGFRSAQMKGSQHNDPWIIKNGKIKTSKNDAGGIIGGISTGMPIEFTIAVKPTATIGIPQKTINFRTMKEEVIQFEGRHDPCIVPRVIVVVEAITAVVLVDYLLIEGYISPLIKK